MNVASTAAVETRRAHGGRSSGGKSGRVSRKVKEGAGGKYRKRLEREFSEKKASSSCCSV